MGRVAEGVVEAHRGTEVVHHDAPCLSVAGTKGLEILHGQRHLDVGGFELLKQFGWLRLDAGMRRHFGVLEHQKRLDYGRDAGGLQLRHMLVRSTL